MADFALQNMVETTFPDGLETSGRKAYRLFWHISRCFLSFSKKSGFLGILGPPYCVCSLLRYRLNVFLPPLPEVGCPKFLGIRNPWKVMERSGLTFEHFSLEVV